MRILHYLLLTVVCMALSQCKSDPKTAPQPSDAAAEPAADKTVRIRIEADATSLNPLTASAYGRNIAGQIFQNLGFVEPKTLELVPLMVKAIPQAQKIESGPYKNCFAYEFELLEEATWDNGTPITGNDVVFTIKTILAPQVNLQQWRSYYEKLRNIEVDPANPKKFTFYFVDFYILALETACQTPIFPAYHYDAAGQLANIPLTDLLDPKKAETLKADEHLKAFAENFLAPKYTNEKNQIVGSNAYQLETLKSGVGVVLVRKKNWWGDKAVAKNPMLAAYPEKLVYRFVKDEGAAENMIKNGELDVVLTISPGKFTELQNNAAVAKQYNFSHQLITWYSYWMLNNRDPKLKDRRVREALAHVVDYEGIIQSIYKGMARRTIGPFGPFKSYYNNAIVPYDYNIQQAQALLKAAGWSDSNGNGIVDKMIDGKRVEFKMGLMASNVAETTRQMAEATKETAKKAGIDIELQWSDLSKISAATREGKYESAQMAAATFPGADDPYQLLHSKSLAPAGDNRSGFADPKADKLMDAIRIEPDVAKRSALYQQFQQVIHEAVPVIYMVVPDQRFVVSNRFEAVITANRPGYCEQFFRGKK